MNTQAVTRVNLLFLILGLLLPIQSSTQSWAAQISNANEPLREIFFISPAVGWAMGEPSNSSTDYLRHTTDGGVNWFAQSIERTNLEIEAAYFLDENIGFVVGELEEGGTPGFLAQTIDGGQSWSIDEQNFPQKLLDVTFQGMNLGWLAGNNGYLAVSENGGQSWSTVATPTDRKLNGLDFFNEQQGLAVGDHGVIIRSSNGGQNWTQVVSGTEEDLLAVTFGDENNAWVVGDKGIILHSIDGGLSWVSQSSGTDRRLFDVDAYSPAVVRAVGKDGIVLRYEPVSSAWLFESSQTDRDIFAIDMVQDSLGWFSGQNGVIHILGEALISADQEVFSSLEGTAVFPNPLSGGVPLRLSLPTGGEFHFSLYDPSGRQILNQKIQALVGNTVTIELDEIELKAGVYWVQLRTEDNLRSYSGKLVVLP